MHTKIYTLIWANIYSTQATQNLKWFRARTEATGKAFTQKMWKQNEGLFVWLYLKQFFNSEKPSRL